MIRRPRIGDVPAMVALINGRAARGEILPRSHNHVYQNIRDFMVCEEGGHLRACGALHVLWGDLGEIRGLASKPSSLEIEGRIVHALLDEGRRLGLPAVFAFTYFPEFFIDLGFRVVPKDDLPRIAWKECIDCIHFPDCNETVVWFDL